MEKMTNMCKVQLTKFSENMCEDELKIFFDQIQERLIYFKRVGLLFNSAKLNKYEKKIKANNSYSRIKSQSPPENRKNSLSKNDDISSDDELDSKNIQDLVFDSQGKFALQAFKSMKKQNTLLLKKISVLEESFKNLVRNYMDKYDSVISHQHKIELIERKLKEIGEKYCEQIDYESQLKKKLNLYKDLEGIENLNDEELSELEKHYFEKLDQLKNEKSLRLYKSEINILRSQLSMPLIEITNLPEPQDKYLLKKHEITAYAAQIENLDMHSEGNDVRTENFQTFKTYKLLSEEEVIWNAYTVILEPLNKEIADATKISEDFDVNLAKNENFTRIIDVSRKHNQKKSNKARKHSFKLDIGTDIMEYSVDIAKNIIGNSNLTKQESPTKEHKYSHTPSISTQPDNNHSTQQNLVDYHELNKIDSEGTSRSNSQVEEPKAELEISKTLSPIKTKKNSIDTDSNFIQENQTYKEATLNTSNSKESTIDSLIYTSIKGGVSKTMMKPALPQVNSNIPKSKNIKQVDANNFNKNKPLVTLSINSSGYSSTRKSSTSPIPMSVYRSQSPRQLNCKKPFQNVSKDVSPVRFLKSKPSKSMLTHSNKLDYVLSIYKNIKDDPNSQITKANQIFPDSSPNYQKGEYANDQFRDKVDFLKADEYEYKIFGSNKEMNYDDRFRDETPIEKEYTSLSISIYSMRPIDRIESMETDMTKFQSGFNSGNHDRYEIQTGETSPRRNERSSDIYSSPSDNNILDINDMRKRRSRADRVGKK